jgi:hypothetical protein
MKLTLTFDTESFSTKVIPEGDATSSKDLRQLLALIQGVMPDLLQNIQTGHAELSKREQGEQTSAVSDDTSDAVEGEVKVEA